MPTIIKSMAWLRDRLNGVSPKQNRKIVLVDGNTKEHPVDEDTGFLFTGVNM
ncbi:MAG: hypothetical protein ABH969_08850 [Pseudomonadota bacterium]